MKTKNAGERDLRNKKTKKTKTMNPNKRSKPKMHETLLSLAVLLALGKFDRLR